MSWRVSNIWGNRVDSLDYYNVITGDDLIDTIVIIEFSSHAGMEALIGGDASDIDLWNTFFNLPAYGNRFRDASVDIAAATILLTGGSNITLRPNLFSGYSGIIAISDTGERHAIVSSGSNVFANASNLSSCYLPGLRVIGDHFFTNNALIAGFNFPSAIQVRESAFEGMTALTTVLLGKAKALGNRVFAECSNLTSLDLSVCTHLGTSVGDNNIFVGTAGIIDVTLLSNTLLTCNSGGLDGDLQFLLDDNRLTVNGVIPGA